MKGKDPVVESFINNADYVVDTLSKVVPRVDIDTLMKFTPKAVFRHLMLNLVEVRSFYHPSSFILSLFLLYLFFDITMLADVCPRARCLRASKQS